MDQPRRRRSPRAACTSPSSLVISADAFSRRLPYILRRSDRRHREGAVRYDKATLDQLVQPDRIHRNLYVDPQLFELEMERIFGRAWIYVGHDSQVAKAGDYIATTIGRQPVVMSRHRDGSLHVLFNRCAH